MFKEKLPVVLSTSAQLLQVKYGIDLEVKGPRCPPLRSEWPGKLTHGNDSSHASLKQSTRLLLSSCPLWGKFIKLISLVKEQTTFFLCTETQFTCQVTSVVYTEQTSNYFYYKYCKMRLSNGKQFYLNALTMSVCQSEI